MAKEIERKFLVVNDSYKALAQSCHHIVQGYLSRDPKSTVRVRLVDDEAFITIKGRNSGAVRDEWEYAIPVSDAMGICKCCTDGRLIEKMRWVVDFDGFIWEIDEFKGRHNGLVLAEIELPAENSEFSLPPFVGEEVTDNPYYYNSNLSAT